MTSCADLIFITIAFIVGYVLGRYPLKLNNLKRILGAASGKSGASVKIGDLVMVRYMLQEGHFGKVANTDVVAYGTIKRVYDSGKVDARWHLYYAPYAGGLWRRSDFPNNFGDEYRNGLEYPSHKIESANLINLPFTVTEDTNCNVNMDVEYLLNVESIEEAASIANLKTGLIVFRDNSFEGWVKTPPIMRPFSDPAMHIVQCKPGFSYAGCAIDLYADDIVTVYHVPADSTKSAIKCKRIRIEVKDKKVPNFLHLAEIQVWEAGKNIASQATITESSTAGDTSTAAAIDGNLNTFNHTNYEASWLELNFANERVVDKIVLYNRRDCDVCFDRIKNFKITVFDGSKRQSATGDLATMFTNQYVAILTKWKQVGYNDSWTTRYYKELPALTRGDKLVFSIINGVGNTGMMGVLIQNKWTIPLTINNLTSPNGKVVQQAYPYPQASIKDALMGVVLEGAGEWINYDLIHTIF